MDCVNSVWFGLLSFKRLTGVRKDAGASWQGYVVVMFVCEQPMQSG
jgi:hypothetical protein